MAKTALHRGVTALTALLLVGVVFVLGALAVSPELHERLHPDAGEHGHQCAVTLFAHGQVDQVTPASLPPVPAPGLELARPEFHFFAVNPTLPETDARGPPWSLDCV